MQTYDVAFRDTHGEGVWIGEQQVLAESAAQACALATVPTLDPYEHLPYGDMSDSNMVAAYRAGCDLMVYAFDSKNPEDDANSTRNAAYATPRKHVILRHGSARERFIRRDDAENLMDGEILDKLHHYHEPEEYQSWFDDYCAAHARKYGEEFCV